LCLFIDFCFVLIVCYHLPDENYKPRLLSF
jgi:hypothetical protein